MTHEDPKGVTVVITRKVLPGHESQYEALVRELTVAAREQDGYLGVDIQRPRPDGDGVYTSIVRFDSITNLRRFEESELRADFLKKVSSHVAENAVWRRMTGLEFWFEPPAGTTIAQPSPFRMAILLVFVVYGLVLSIGGLIGSLASAWPFPVRLFATIVVEVFAMTYVVMPRLTRLLARWIYPSTKST